MHLARARAIRVPARDTEQQAAHASLLRVLPPLFNSIIAKHDLRYSPCSSDSHDANIAIVRGRDHSAPILPTATRQKDHSGLAKHCEDDER